MVQEYFKDCMTEEQLKARHRELVVKMHPDKNPDNPNATAEFQEMQAQYDERLAELHGDYRASAKGRERRERYAREQAEREERERKEREQRRFEEVINQARLNKGNDFHKLNVGDYVYAKKLNGVDGLNTRLSFEWDYLTGDEVLCVSLNVGTADETVVKIEQIIETTDAGLLYCAMSDDIKKLLTVYGPMGGWETIQQANPMGGVRKTRKVAKVVMWVSDHYCMFGNPMGDPTISDYYVPVNYESMFSDRLHIIQSEIERQRLEQERKEAERKAKIIAEQKPLIAEWKDKLITISAALSSGEKDAIAIANLKTVLKKKFPGVRFKVVDCHDGSYRVRWTDGPTREEVQAIESLFLWHLEESEHTPWQERYGLLAMHPSVRDMSTLTKASILQQLGEVSDVFTTADIYDLVEVSDIDWQMMHLMAGVNVYDPNHPKLCYSFMKDGKRMVELDDAVSYIFDHTSYGKKAKKKAAKAA